MFDCSISSVVDGGAVKAILCGKMFYYKLYEIKKNFLLHDLKVQLWQEGVWFGNLRSIYVDNVGVFGPRPSACTGAVQNQM